jgi:hypothetical protein
VRILVVLVVAAGCGRFGFELGREGEGDDGIDSDEFAPDGATTTNSPDADTTQPMPDAAIDAPAVTCAGYGDVPGLANKYRFVSTAMKWHQAVADCASDGGYLVVLDDATERDTFAVDDIWIGISDEAEQTVWTTVCGDAATYLPWGANEPDNAAGEDCGRLRVDTGKIADADCDKQYVFVCECEP